MTPLKDHPMPPAGTVVAVVPSNEFLGLILTLAEVVKYAIEIDTFTQHGAMPPAEMTHAMRTLSTGLKDRLCTMPAGVMRAPAPEQSA
jgi:hypothetical protein